MELSHTQKHFMRLVRKDKGKDGWTPVSKTVMTGMKFDPSFIPPDDLIDIETLAAGRGRARLTERGNVIADYS